jgi:hypothetical protein
MVGAVGFVISDSVDIAAAPEAVWQVMTDFDRYPEWNPFAVRCSTSLLPGDPIDMSVAFILPGRRRLRQREWIRTHTPGREFSYSMAPVPFSALRSRRTQSITPLGDAQTRYTSRFELSGWLHPVVQLLLGARLHRGFHAMTAALLKRVEQSGENAG